ncbi:MAG: quinone-dependent dihydroorotate dehydrogenase [Gammaproteobacteria bacterium]|nr:quinone-dependent dihydroorotate dehydrogenase [Gammaproteobacteria bacterium]
MYGLVRRLLFLLGPETSHRVAISALQIWGALPGTGGHAGAPREVMGIEFANCVGLAAGLDKDAKAVAGLARLGFGHIEVGTVTPRAQPGNPSPRLFRLPMAEALINRMGFNNDGMNAMAGRLARLREGGGLGTARLGINIGKNRDTDIEDAHRDYVACMDTLYEYADYLAVNLSSPNTPGLRSLQGRDPLRRLLGALKERQALLAARHGRHVPIAVKIGPDLNPEGLEAVARELVEFAVEGVIATNTTVSRPVVRRMRHGGEAGGLSGAPLKALARGTVTMLDEILDGRIPVIGAGGVMSAADAEAMLLAGASLVQVYTGLIYRGPGLVGSVAAVAP